MTQHRNIKFIFLLPIAMVLGAVLWFLIFLAVSSLFADEPENHKTVTPPSHFTPRFQIPFIPPPTLHPSQVAFHLDRNAEESFFPACLSYHAQQRCLEALTDKTVTVYNDFRFRCRAQFNRGGLCYGQTVPGHQSNEIKVAFYNILITANPNDPSCGHIVRTRQEMQQLATGNIEKNGYWMRQYTDGIWFCNNVNDIMPDNGVDHEICHFFSRRSGHGDVPMCATRKPKQERGEE
jgi:hypothetical protein